MATNDGGGAAAAAGGGGKEDGAAAGQAMQLLGAMQLSDSMFPSGLFATSNGLESMFLDGSVSSAGELAGLCRTLVDQQVGPCDCVMAARACSLAAAGDDARLAELDARCSALKPVREQREAAARSGAQIARCVERFGGGKAGGILARYCRAVSSGGAPGAYPVALGACCGSLGMPPGHAALVALYGFAASMVGAGLRLGIIDHMEGQEIIHGLKPRMAEAAREAEARAAGGDAEAWQFAPLAEIAQMGHERMDARMFAA